MRQSDKFSLKQKLILFFGEHLGALLIRFLGWTCRLEVQGEENLRAAEAQGQGVILAIWHGRMLLPVYHLRRRGYISLASLHFDGELMARLAQRLGYVIHRGSPKKGGGEGFKAMLRDLKANQVVSIFPDGPKGPRHSIRDGVLHLARLTGTPVVPLSCSASPCWRAASWDQYLIMKPFSRGLIKFGQPFYIPRKFKEHEDLNTYRVQLQNILIQLERELDVQLGVEN